MNEDETWAALAAAWDLPYGAAQVAAVERVMAAADAGEWPALRFAARSLAVVAYEYAGEASKMFVPFAWCVAALDRGEAPDERSEGMVLWRFKHVVSQLSKFPDVPLSRTRSVLDDMERRYRAGGYSMHAVHQHRWLVAAHVGDTAEAAEQYRLWCAAPRDQMSDCVGCEPTARIEHLAAIGADEEAIELSVPVLAGTLTCAEQPQMILTALLLPYLRTGRYEQAADAHRRAYRRLRSSHADLASIAEHVEFCARTGNEPRGLELVQRHLGWLAAPPDPYAEMRFAAAAALLLRRLTAAGRGDTELDRPPLTAGETAPATTAPATTVPATTAPATTEPATTVRGTTTAAALGEELAARASAIAARFDRRNGTGHQGAQIAALLTAEPLVDRLPLARAGWGSTVPSPAASAEPVAVPELPADPVALADAAERYRQDLADEAEQAVWTRFDEVCPEPAGELAGRRLVARGRAVSDDDLPAAERYWRAAAELFTAAPVRRHDASSLAGLARCRQGDPDTGLAELTAARDALAALAADRPSPGAHPARGGPDPLAGNGSAPIGTNPAIALRAAVERLAMGLDAADRLPAAIATGRQALALPADDRHTGRTHALLAFMTANAGDATAAHAHATEAVRLLAGHAPELVAQVRMLAGRLHARDRDFAAASGEFRAAAAGATGTARAEALRLYGHAALDADRPDEAVEPLTEAIGLWAGSDHPRPAAYLRAALADALIRTGRYDEAASVGEDALTALDTGDDLPTRVDTLLLLGAAYRELHAPDAAVEALAEVAEHCAAEGNEAGVGEANARIAEILDGVDRDAEAARRWATAAAAFRTARLAATASVPADTPGADTPGADTPGVDSAGTDVTGADSAGADSAGTDVTGADSAGADTPGADTPGADSPGADSPGVDSPGVDSAGTDVTGAGAEPDVAGADTEPDADGAERVARLAVDELRAARNAALSWQWADEPDRALAALPAADAAAEAAGTDRPRACWEVAVLGYDAGRILANAGRPAEALARTESAVALFAGLRAGGDLDPTPTPVEVAVRTLRARLLIETGRRADARGTLTALLDELPPDAEEHRAAIAALLADTEH